MLGPDHEVRERSGALFEVKPDTRPGHAQARHSSDLVDLLDPQMGAHQVKEDDRDAVPQTILSAVPSPRGGLWGGGSRRRGGHERLRGGLRLGGIRRGGGLRHVVFEHVIPGRGTSRLLRLRGRAKICLRLDPERGQAPLARHLVFLGGRDGIGVYGPPARERRYPLVVLIAPGIGAANSAYVVDGGGGQERPYGCGSSTGTSLNAPSKSVLMKAERQSSSLRSAGP